MRYALSGRQPFSAPAERSTRTAYACSSLTDGMFFAEIQRGFAYPAGAQEGKHLRFPPSNFHPFPLFVSLAQTRDRRPLRNGERQSVTVECLS